MNPLILWHNPRCSKSRDALALIRDEGIEPVVVNYLTNPPSAKELDRVLVMLGLEPLQLIRTGESVWRELGNDPELGRDALIALMVAHPILIERPVAINGDRAVLGRPPERVLDVLPKR